MKTMRNLVLFFLFGMILMETLSFVGLIAVEFFHENKSFKTTLINRAQEAIDSIDKNLQKSGKKSTSIFYDPLIQIRHNPGTFYADYLKINSLGFISSNEEAGKPYENFFKKPPGEFRVVLLGGSSMAGSGAKNYSETIPARLEKLLIDNNKTPEERTYRVFNFGSAGGYSGAELIKILMEVIYYEPDIIVTLDGFNDAFNTILEPYRQTISHSILNWGDSSYFFYEWFNGLNRPQKESAGPFLLYTKKFFKAFSKTVFDLKRIKMLETLYEKHPGYLISQFLMEKSPHLENVLENNLRAAAAVSVANKISYLAYLQPHALQFKSLSVEEEKNLSDWFYSYSFEFGPAFQKENYEKTMNPVFDSYSRSFERLILQFKQNPTVRFEDIRRLFANEKGTMYHDNIHYTNEGNKIIASKIYHDIETVKDKKF